MEISDELVFAFAEAVPFALREMAGVEAFVREEHPATADDGFGGLSANVRLAATGGAASFSMLYPEQTAIALTRCVLAGTTDQASPELVRDCIGEVANVVAGQAKALLVGSPAHFTLSTPTVRSGDPGALPAHARAIAFESSVGRFTVLLCSEDNR